MNNCRIIFIYYMRVIAFSLVVLGHKFSKDLSTQANDASNHITLRWFYSILADASVGGAMGVVIFFLVSGYIITHVLQKESTFIFYLKRVCRIYPLYIFAVFMEVLQQYFYGDGIPTLHIIISRLLLIGDFFNTPLSLGGVEWTLRIEILFYVFMGIIKKLDLLEKGNVLTILLLIVTLMLFYCNPLPVTQDFHNGYFTLYVPFLFIGVIVYLLEEKLISTGMSITFILIIFYLHLSLIEKVSPAWGQYNYALSGIIIFITSWFFKDKLVESKIFNLLSELTCAIYLFHNWIWLSLSRVVNKIGLLYINSNVQILALLFLVCYVAHKTIERKGVKFGKKYCLNHSSYLNLTYIRVR